MFLRRALTYCENMTTSPLLTRIGDVPSGPPPLGRIVVLRAVRLFNGTGGYKRRPGIKELAMGKSGLERDSILTLFNYHS